MEFIVEIIKEYGYVIDWIGYYKEGKRCNWNEKTIRGKIDEGISILYLPEQQEEFWMRLDEILTMIRDFERKE